MGRCFGPTGSIYTYQTRVNFVAKKRHFFVTVKKIYLKTKIHFPLLGCFSFLFFFLGFKIFILTIYVQFYYQIISILPFIYFYFFKFI